MTNPSNRLHGIERLREIIQLASKLNWLTPKETSVYNPSYPLMQLSEVEKCMLCMVNDFELERLRKWAREGICNP